MAVNITYNDRVEYTLQNKDYGSLIINEPIGWETDEMEFSRHQEYHGMIINFSNNLKFIGDAADYITLIYEIYGINAELLLRRKERHPRTNKWENTYIGYLDLSTYEKAENQISCKFNSGGLIELLKSRESEKIEIERTDTLDGNPLEELETKNVLFEGRRIFLKSLWDISDTNNSAFAQVESNDGNTRNQTVGIPLKIVSNSHIDIAGSVTPQTTATENNGDLGMMFMFDNNRERTFDINLNVSFNAFFQQYEQVQWCRYKVCLTTYQNGFNFDVKNRFVLHELRSENPPETNQTSDLALPADFRGSLPLGFTIPISTSYENDSFVLLAGESLA